jgi:hypothetical protein
MYCYFATVDANWNSAYPYAVGPTFYGIKSAVKVTSITETVSTYSPSTTPSIYIAAFTKTICQGTALTFTSAVTNGGTSPSYQWKINGQNAGTNSNTFTTSSLNNNDVVTCVLTTATNGNATSNSIQITVNSCSVTLNLKLFLEGFYRGNGSMAGILNSSTTDTITVELASGFAPYNIQHTIKTLVSITGNAVCSFPSTILGNSYYVVVNHRSSIKTWSGQTVYFTGSTVNYDFTNALNKAYGNNLSDLGDGNFGIFSGDVSDAVLGRGFQDGVVESQDYADEENAVSQTLLGYQPEDLTGDGIVETSDYSLMENNVYYSRSVIRP